jgi:glycosyltransferase involved in cell wall biosynthesis
VGDSVGGSYISSYYLIRGLKSLGVTVKILLHENGKFAEWLESKKCDFEIYKLCYAKSGIGPILNWSRILVGTYRAKYILKKLNIDIVHCNDSRMNRSWAVWAKAANVPMIWHQRSRWPRKHGKQIKISLRFSKGVISISKFINTDVPHLKVPNTIIYNPIAIEDRDKQYSSYLLKKELGLSLDTKIIGCFGNSVKWKRPDTFIQAALNTKKRYHGKTAFIWCGDDRDGNLTNLINTTNNTAPIFRLKFRKDVLTTMAGCDIIIAPSENEPFGRTLVEAMGVGVPIIASNSGGHVEIIENEYNGLLFKVGNAKACSMQIYRLLTEDHLREKLIFNGKKTASKFDPLLHAKTVLHFYGKLKKK